MVLSGLLVRGKSRVPYCAGIQYSIFYVFKAEFEASFQSPSAIRKVYCNSLVGSNERRCDAPLSETLVWGQRLGP